jgi:hypothetical protein
MITMQPLSLIAGGVDGQGLHIYRVRFDRAGEEVAYRFTVDNGDSPGVTADDEFIEATFRDPFAPALYQAILQFHQARQGEASVEANPVGAA